MNREIEFRGKLLKTSDSFKTYEKGTMIYGGYCKQGDKHYIVAHFNVFDVDPETVGQFTGLRDSKRTKEFPKGEKIYEKQLFKFQYREFGDRPIDLVGKFVFSGTDLAYEIDIHSKEHPEFVCLNYRFHADNIYQIEIIDNPELLR